VKRQIQYAIDDFAARSREALAKRFTQEIRNSAGPSSPRLRQTPQIVRSGRGAL